MNPMEFQLLVQALRMAYEEKWIDDNEASEAVREALRTMGFADKELPLN